MIKRIKKINGIGTFSDFNSGGQHELGRTTLIHGLNCHGKSTLCDVLLSLSKDNPEIIRKRKTIRPAQEKPQCVELSVEKASRETSVNFEHNAWSCPADFEDEISIFDARFVNDNVFTGLEITRENRENMTDLILGEENVALAKQIELLNQKSRRLNKEIKGKTQALQRVFPGIDIGLLMDFTTEQSSEQIQESLEEKQKARVKLEQNIAQAKTFLDKAEPKDMQLQTDSIDLLDKINGLLARSFEDIQEDALDKLKQHIESNFCNKDGFEEQWIIFEVIFLIK